MPIKERARLALRTTANVLKRTYLSSIRDGISRMGAALAYYTIFSLPPLIILLISLVGHLYGESAIEGQIFHKLRDFFGDDIAIQVQSAVAGISNSTRNGWAAIVGGVFLVIGASSVFNALQDSLHRIFGVYPENRKGFFQDIINKAISLAMILCLGLLLLSSVIIGSIEVYVFKFIEANGDWLNEKVAEGFSFLVPLINFFTSSLTYWISVGTSFLLLVLFFFILYKFLPDAKIRNRNLWIGAFVAAGLFWVGKSLISYYVAHTNITSAYGAAGTLVVMLLWVYFSAQLVFLGAELVKSICAVNGDTISARSFANRILSSKFAQRIKARIKPQKGGG